jgi:hypothetical protein
MSKNTFFIFNKNADINNYYGFLAQNQEIYIFDILLYFEVVIKM